MNNHLRRRENHWLFLVSVFLAVVFLVATLLAVVFLAVVVLATVFLTAFFLGTDGILKCSRAFSLTF